MPPTAFVTPLALSVATLHRATTPRRGRASAAPRLCASSGASTNNGGEAAFPVDPNHHPVSDIDPRTLPDAHPYGTGGVPSEVDWAGYDAAELARETEAAERDMAAADPRRHDGPWAILLNADVIQWKNNVFDASQAEGSGFRWDSLSGVRLVRLSAVTARREIAAVNRDLHTIECASRPIVTPVVDNQPPCLVAFTGLGEADRFAELLKADVDDPVTVRARPTNVLADMCEENGILLAVVPTRTLISPAMLGIKRPSAPTP